MIQFGIWCAVLLVIALLSVLAHKLAFLIFTLGPLVSAILGLLNFSWLISVPVFLGISVLASIVILIIKHNKLHTFRSIDNSIGERCRVFERIDNLCGSGEVKVGSQVWSARSVYDDQPFECGEEVMIVAVEGVKLICKSIKD